VTIATPLGPEMVLVADELITPTHTLRPGWIRLSGRRIDAVGTGTHPPPDAAAGGSHGHVTRMPTGWRIIPGLVDMHVHGAGGWDMSAPDRRQIVEGASALLRAGVTTTVVTLITAPVAELEASADLVAGLMSDPSPELPRFAGTHFEGPFLSHKYRGAHHVPSLQLPDRTVLTRLLEAGRGTVRMCTLAPELPGGPEIVRLLVDRGVIAAMGHTGASLDQTRQAIEQGVTVGTHLFNGMRRPHHREPGPAFTLLDDESVTVELINDGLHVHPTAARIASRASAEGRLALISDAVAATNAPEGHYKLGRVDIRNHGGSVQTADGMSLGGGNVTLDGALRRAVTELGMTLQQAVTAATWVPANALGVSQIAGELVTGRDADLCVLDSELRVAGVMRAGRWLSDPDISLAVTSSVTPEQERDR